MTDDRDMQVARTLKDVPVPDHHPHFWPELEARLAAVQAPSDRTGFDANSGRAPSADRDTALPVVVDLAARRRRRLGPTMASVAAALLLVMVAAVTLTSGDPSSKRVQVVEPATDGQPTTATTRDSATPNASATAEDTLLEWVAAVGAGDIETAAKLTGPRSVAYVNALSDGGGIEGSLAGAKQFYGAWADSPDRSTTEISLDTGDPNEEIIIVVLTGTWNGEGVNGFRTDATPVVRSGDGGWLVEPWATDPATGGRITVVSPSAAEEGGFNGLAPDETLSAGAPGSGTFHFSIDDQPATSVAGRKAGSGVSATFDPPGAMSSQTHLFVIAYVDGATVSAVSGTFTVEG